MVPIAVVFTSISESAIFPLPISIVTLSVNCFTGPLSTEYVPLVAFFKVNVIDSVSASNVEPLAKELVTFGVSSSTSSVYT